MSNSNYKFQHELYKVGIYTRLSREDEKDKESESIDTQKKLLTNYVKSQGWTLYKIYVDDGYTGTNYDRPDFKNLINDIELGNVNLVITKDLSRLGRDYIDTGYYLEKYFPLKKVRYIALNDGIDTFDGNNASNDMTPFKSVFNDMYAKDISKKVRSSLMTKIANGENIKAFEPYGYKKDENNRKMSVIDYEVSWVVEKIFEMYYMGETKAGIVRYLNENEILTPVMYKIAHTNYYNPNNSTNTWSASMVTKILRDKHYIGDLVGHKFEKINYKTDKSEAVPEENQIVTKNKHEAIIDKELFDTVQELLNKKANEWNYCGNEKHLLTGLVFCKKCKSRITYNKNHGKQFRCVCSRYKRNGAKFCNNIHLKEEILIETVISDLKDKAKKFLKYNELKYNDKVSTENKKRIEHITTKIKEKENLIQSLYEDKVKKIITEEFFIKFYEKYNREINELNLQLKNEKEKKFNNMDKIRLQEDIKKVLEFKDKNKDKNIDRNIIFKLIDRIEIDDSNIEIQYKFKTN